MRWVVVDEELRGFSEMPVDFSGTSVALLLIADYSASLLPPEQKEATQFKGRRSDHFSSGRYAARCAQIDLGLTPSPIGKDGRVPIWPRGLVGAISHDSMYAGAMVSNGFRGVGIDFEKSDRVQEKLFKKLFSSSEIENIRDLPNGAATIMFSAKESIYKAIYPILRRYVGFHEVEIKLDWEAKTFDVQYVGKEMTQVMVLTRGGCWAISGGHVLTVFWVG